MQNSVDYLRISYFQAIGARNQLKSTTKKREAQQQQLQALIAEKHTQMERQVCQLLLK